MGCRIVPQVSKVIASVHYRILAVCGFGVVYLVGPSHFIFHLILLISPFILGFRVLGTTPLTLYMTHKWKPLMFSGCPLLLQGCTTTTVNVKNPA